jgi:hypothetical protein
MKQKYFYLFAILCICGMSFLSHAVAQEASKPILLMGTGYSSYERKAIIQDILEPNELTFEEGDEFTSAEVWKNYSLIIVTHGFPKLNENEIGWIQDYVKEGGKVLLTGPVLASLRELKPANRDWLGAEGYQIAKGADFVISNEGTKFVDNAATAQGIFGVANSYAPAKLGTAKSLVLRGSAPILFSNNYGKGEVWFAGLEYFRILNTRKDQKEKMLVGAPARELLEKLILQGGAQKKSEQIASALKTLGARSPIVWRRDFASARGAAFAVLPYPQKGEELNHIHLDLGENEWESMPFYLTNGDADNKFAISISDLISTETKTKIPASAIRLRVQGLAAPQLTVGPFWLLDVPRHDAPGKSTFDFPLQNNTSNTIWLTLNTIDILPGEYQGKISFSNPAMKSIDFQIKVWPVRLPGREYFETEATYNWNSLLNGEKGKTYNFPDPPGNMKSFDQHVSDLAEHYIDYNEDGSWLNNYGGSISLKNVKLKGTEIKLEDAMAKGLIKENALPQLDFSYFDPFVEKPLLAVMPYFHFNFKNYPKDWLSYARAISGDKELAPDSPQHLAIKRWLLGQIVDYLHSKGITKIVSFIADEIPPDEIPDVLERAKLMHEFGISVEFTATGQTGQKREYISQLNPAIDRWIWNTGVMPQAKAIVKTNSPIDATDTQYNYTADWHRAPYVFNRTRGAFCAYNQLDGWFIHGYLRWYPNGGAVYKTPEGPIDTEGWEGARDGIEDARYWKRAQLLLQAAKGKPQFATKVTQIEEQMKNWVSPNSNALVQLKDASYSIYNFQSPVSSYARLQTLKHQLLESLVWLQQNVPTAFSLNYAGLKLVDSGKSQVQIIGNTTAAAAMTKVFSARGLPTITSQPTGKFKIAFGTSAKLKVLLGNDFITESPTNGDYQIVVKGNTIAVTGGDENGLIIGAHVLGNVIEAIEEPRA